MTVIFRGNQEFDANASSYTVSAADLGDASADRYVMIACGGRGSTSAAVISSVTVGGVSATEVGSVTSGSGSFRSTAKSYVINVPTGTTADIVVNFSGSVLRAGVSWWTDDNLGSTTPHDTGVSTSSSTLTTSVDKTDNGWIQVYSQNFGSDPCAPIGYTEEFEENIEGSGNSHTGGQYTTPGSLTGHVIESDWSTLGVPTLLVISWDAAAPSTTNGFYEIPVNTSEVSGSHTNMPLLVIPSQIDGIGEMTLAQAQSTRFYSDASKSIELAREIVSEDEIHVKVPSVTTTTSIYVDFDGTRSDYLVTDTYGAESVWSDYLFVWHGGTLTDSVGLRTISSNGGITVGGVDGKIGKATDFDGVDDFLNFGDFSITDGIFSTQVWLKADTLTGDDFHALSKDATGRNSDFKLWYRAGLNFRIDMDTPASTITINNGFALNTGQHYLVHSTYDNSTLKLFFDGQEEASTNTANLDVVSTGNDWCIGSQFDVYDDGWDGVLEQVRISSTTLSSNWITTEYNNQNNNSTFWGTASWQDKK